MKTPSTARLLLDGTDVGEVVITGSEGAWRFGTFHPSDAFQSYATPFNRWAQLMHAGTDRIPREAADELREIENSLYAIRASVHIPAHDEWHDVAILTIDGPLIEWKEKARS